MKYLSILIFFLAILHEYSFAQDYTITEFGEEDGLVQSAVYCIKQDENGLIWIGTNQGLYRYDGFKFKHYGPEDGMSDTEIFVILGDSSKFLLMVNFIGKVNYYSNGKIYNQHNDKFLRDIQLKNTPSGIKISNTKYILYGGASTRYFYILEEENGRIIDLKTVNLPENNSFSHVTYSNDIISIFNCSDNSKCIAYRYDVTGKLLKSEHLESYQYPIPISEKENVIVNKKTFSLNDSESGTEIYRREIETEIKYLFNFGSNLWATSRNGVVLFSDGKRIKKYFSHIPINHVYEDRENNVWLGTEGEGLKLLQKRTIKNLFSEDNTTISNVKCIESIDSNNLIIGHSNSAFSVYNEEAGLTHHELIKNGKNINNRITDIELISNNEVLFGTDNGIYKWDNSSSNKINTYSIGSIKCIMKFQESIYYGSASALTKSKLPNGVSENIWLDRAISLDSDNKDQIWFGGNLGLHKLNTETNVVSEVTGPISARRINYIEWYDEKLYLATNAGIYTIVNDSASLLVDIKDGLPDNNCLKLTNDQKNLWIATARGLVKLNKEAEQTDIEVYTVNDGLESNNINDILVRGNNILIATSNGINSLKINSVKKKEQFEVNILEIYNNDTIFNVYDPVVLKEGSKTLSVYFAALSYGNKCKYKYRMGHSSDNWKMLTENTILFTDLKPGKFTFEVKAISLDGLESKQAATIDIKVLPFLYETMWFKVFSLLTFLLLLYFLFRKRQQGILATERKKNEIQRQQSLLELEAIKAQINPHFIYNSLNSIQYSILKGANKNAESQLASFSKLVRQTLDYSKKNFITLEQETKYLTRYLNMEKLRFKETLDFEVSNSIKNPSQFLVPSLLIQPYVENAIKHGLSIKNIEKSKVKVYFTIKGERLICKVEDSGVGIDFTSLSKDTPSGLKLSSKRADTYNNLYSLDIKIDVENKTHIDGQTTGTLVTISLPVKTKV